MSAHADANEIMRWLGTLKQAPANTFLVHGEPGPIDALAARIASELKWTVTAPAWNQQVELV
jgi:metallo-beta-lactamase family protein